MQVRISEDLNKEELNQNQLLPLGCIAAGSGLGGFGVCVSFWNPSCWMIELVYVCCVALMRLNVQVHSSTGKGVQVSEAEEMTRKFTLK